MVAVPPEYSLSTSHASAWVLRSDSVIDEQMSQLKWQYPKRAQPVVPNSPRSVENPLGHPKLISSSVKGKASWYCSVGIPICHYAYPPGSHVAAACRKLRQAMGPNWRGQTVTVTSDTATITVRLVDYCASTDKLIDLYREPMRLLGGDGVLNVTVSW